ncbi:unnamed protein product [Oikopleura dioica]|uniref:Uncharacterized protein n=1 Tax=Oikopleura dioica TaxID=34765 RepID=E4XSW9_OIKDI|nr:unnamed protein product [Oikopleura dioica]
MSNGPPSTTYSESNLTNTTPPDFNSPADQTHEISKAAINELIKNQVDPIWNALGKAMKERAEMQKKIDELETSEQELKNQVENFDLNNAQLVDRVEKVETENAELKQMLNEMEISGQIKRLEKQHDSEREEWKSEKQEMEEKMETLELNLNLELKNEIKKRQDLGELIMMRTELGEIGGAGHFFGNDKEIDKDGVRDEMRDKDLKKVLRLLAAGEKKINLKFYIRHNWEVAEAGWTIQFKTADKDYGGDGKYFYLWISNKEGGAKFKAIAQQIKWNGEEKNRRELRSEKDGTRERIKYEDVAGYVFVRFNITFL